MNGTLVPREEQLSALTVMSAVDRISSARLVYLDGSASAGQFRLANEDTFAPGAEVEILAGSINDPVSIFKGVVVKQALRARQRGSSQLIVECRHGAFKMTLGRKNAVFAEMKDSDVLSQLISDAGLTADVESTSVTHPQLVQYRATDWDFLVSRAQANGMLVMTSEDKVIVKARDASASPSVSLTFGSTIHELDLEIDAREQFSAMKGRSWDGAALEVIEVDATDPSISGPGNWTTSDLAGVGAAQSYDLLHTALSEPELSAWADAEWKRSQSNRVGGRLKCEGIATVKVGDMVTLAGIGDRYNGDVFVTAVRHDSSVAEGFRTYMQFGGMEAFREVSNGISAPKAAGLLPSVSGLQIGKVISNEDSGNEFRVRLSLPLVDAEGDGIFARIATLEAGAERGFFFRPEAGDEVVVGFLEDDPRHPIILGALHSSTNAAPLTGTEENNERVYQSRSKMRLSFDDDKKVLILETPGGNKITLSDDAKGITLEDQNGNILALDADGVRIESSKALTLKSSAEASIEAGSSLSAKASSSLSLEGSSGAELKSSGTTGVKGSQVKLGS